MCVFHPQRGRGGTPEKKRGSTAFFLCGVVRFGRSEAATAHQEKTPESVFFCGGDVVSTLGRPRRRTRKKKSQDQCFFCGGGVRFGRSEAASAHQKKKKPGPCFLKGGVFVSAIARPRRRTRKNPSQVCFLFNFWVSAAIQRCELCVCQKNNAFPSLCQRMIATQSTRKHITYTQTET